MIANESVQKFQKELSLGTILARLPETGGNNGARTAVTWDRTRKLPKKRQVR